MNESWQQEPNFKVRTILQANTYKSSWIFKSSIGMMP